MKHTLRWAVISVCAFGLPYGQTLAQSKPVGTTDSSLCTRDGAIEMILQQRDATRTFDDAIRRIAVLIRAADLLWPFQQDKAREAFTEALEVASRNEKEKREKSKDSQRVLIMEMQVPDQRYVVIRAVAKRDTDWAKGLTRQVLRQDRQSEQEASTRDPLNDVLIAYRLLDSASQLLPTNVNAAFDLARASLNYPASAELTRFLYKVAQGNQQAADQFYDQALGVYRDKPVREFLYLQAYPFAFREGGDMPIFGFYDVPANFSINSSLQRRFVQSLVRRAQQALEVPLDEGDSFNQLPGTGHIMQVLTRLEPHVRVRQPDLLEAVVQAREKIMVSLSADAQKRVLKPAGNDAGAEPEKTFAELLETAEKTPNVNSRDDLIAVAVLDDSDKESLASVVAAIDKIMDSGIRTTLMEWVYFRRTMEALKGNRFDEVETLMSKVTGREQRAYLHTEIARELLKTGENRQRVRELLEEAINEADKGGKTISSARILLTTSNLYSKVDVSRSISVLGDAVARINRLEAPDFSVGDQTLIKEVKRKSNAGRFVIRFPMPGLDPESAFREMARIDFDGALAQSSALTDKFQRAMTTLVLADSCLRQVTRPVEKPRKKSRA